MANTYVMMDENSIVLNIINMDDEPISEETLSSLREQNNASIVLRLDNGQVSENSAVTVKPYNNPIMGSTFKEDTFIPPKPSDEYILDPTNTTWILPYSAKKFDEMSPAVLNSELNYWDVP